MVKKMDLWKGWSPMGANPLKKGKSTVDLLSSLPSVQADAPSGESVAPPLAGINPAKPKAVKVRKVRDNQSIGARARNRGKLGELGAARYWGCKRVHFEKHDLEGHPVLTIEVKSRQKPNKTVNKWIAQSIAAAQPGHIGVVHLHENGRNYKDDVVIIRAQDLQKLVGKGEFYQDGKTMVGKEEDESDTDNSEND